LRQLVNTSFGAGSPLVLPFGRVAVIAHSNVDNAETADRIGRRTRLSRESRRHRVQERQRQRGAGAAQERPPGQRQLSDNHCDLLIWKGVLSTIPMMIDEKRYPRVRASCRMARTAVPSQYSRPR